MSIRALKEAALELKLGSARLEDNESSMPRPVDLQPAPEKKECDPEACFMELAKGQNAVLPKVFGEFSSSSSKDKSFIHEHFSSRDYQSRSPLLRKHAQAGLCASDRTLAEQARGLLDR